MFGQAQQRLTAFDNARSRTGRAVIGCVPNLIGKPAGVRRLAALIAVFVFTMLSGEGPVLRADVDFPTVEPLHTIYVRADTVARESQGDYDVLCFDGHCNLRQGDLVASADRIVLWIEQRTNTLGMRLPGKIIYLLDGNAEVQWNAMQKVRDERWMGRLFSLHPVDIDASQEIKRFDIPQLNWNNANASRAVQPAQYVQSGNDSTAGIVGTPGLGSGQPSAPPLLTPTPASMLPSPTSLPSTSGPATGPTRDASGSLPTASGSAGTASGIVPTSPGAVQWTANGSTRSSDLVPSSGLVIPDDGTQPYPAAGIPEQPLEAIPAFPSQTQVVRQLPLGNMGAKTIEFLPRGSRELSISFSPQPNGESVGTVRGGFRLVIHDVQVGQGDGTITDFGTVTLEAENAVVWLRGDNSGLNLGGLTSTMSQPIELYLDGNIVFQQGQRVIYADRMYYNVSNEYGMVLSAEVLTPMPQYQGLLRLKADVLQQRDRQNFMAYGAAFTSSRLGVPRYWMQASEVTFQDQAQ